MGQIHLFGNTGIPLTYYYLMFFIIIENLAKPFEALITDIIVPYKIAQNLWLLY